MYGEVKYFVPHWEDQSFETGIEQDLSYLSSLNIQDVQNKLPDRYYTCGRKAKPNVNGYLHQLHDLEIPNDNTISTN